MRTAAAARAPGNAREQGAGERHLRRRLVACGECDLLQQEVPLAGRSDAHCVRCNALLYRGSRIRLDLLLCLTLGCALLFAVANLFPIARLAAEGFRSSTTLFGTVLALYDEGRPLVAALVLVTAIVNPALELAMLLWMLLPLRLGRVPGGLAALFRGLVVVQPWSMTEVFLLGILVTLVKLGDLANVAPGIALWAFIGMIGLFAAVSASFSVRDFWHWVEQARTAGQERVDNR